MNGLKLCGKSVHDICSTLCQVIVVLIKGRLCLQIICFPDVGHPHLCYHPCTGGDGDMSIGMENIKNDSNAIIIMKIVMMIIMRN